MSKRGEIESLGDIVEAIRRIKAYMKGLKYESFLKDTKTQDAVICNLQIIGEATKNISGEFRKTYPEIPWHNMAGVRDKLVHHYFGVNYEIVWAICKEDLKGIEPRIKEITAKSKI